MYFMYFFRLLFSFLLYTHSNIAGVHSAERLSILVGKSPCLSIKDSHGTFRRLMVTVVELTSDLETIGAVLHSQRKLTKTGRPGLSEPRTVVVISV